MSAHCELPIMKLTRNCHKNAVEVTLLCIKVERKETKIDTVLNSSSKTMLFSSSKPGCWLINHPLCVQCHVCDCMERWGGAMEGLQSVPANTAVTACAWCGNVDTSRLEEQRQEREAGELKMGALRWWRLLNENWNNGEQKQTFPQGTGSTWENAQEHQTAQINYCTRPQCVNSGLSPLLRWMKKNICTDDKIMTQALTGLIFSAISLGKGWVIQEGLIFLTSWNFQAIDDWLANKPHTENVNLISCHACWGKNVQLRSEMWG